MKIIYIVLFVYSKIGRRSALHVSDGCFALYSVGFALPPNTVYRNKFNELILTLTQGGLVDKLMRDVKYSEKKRASGRQQPIVGVGKPLRMNTPEERGLTLADTEGMFILLGIGFIVALAALISEWVGGCTNRVVGIMKRRKGERLERERVEREEHEHDENPSRRPSWFFGGKSRKSSKLATPKSTDRLSLASNSSTSIPSISKQALQELYDGPEKKYSAMVYIDGEMVPDDKVYEFQREQQLRKEIFMTKTQSSTESSHSGSEKSRQFENHFDIIAEVNNEVDNTPQLHYRRSNSTVNEDIFGEKVFY